MGGCLNCDLGDLGINCDLQGSRLWAALSYGDGGMGTQEVGMRARVSVMRRIGCVSSGDCIL